MRTEQRKQGTCSPNLTRQYVPRSLPSEVFTAADALGRMQGAAEPMPGSVRAELSEGPTKDPLRCSDAQLYEQRQSFMAYRAAVQGTIQGTA